MKNSNVIKVIGLSVYLILSLMFIVSVIVKFVDNMKIRTILFIISCIVLVLLAGVMSKGPTVVRWLIGSLSIMIILIWLVVSVLSASKGLSMTMQILTSFQGNNGYTSFYHKGIGGKRYDNIESILEDELEYRKKTQYLGDDDLEEIYRIQVGEKIFVYLKQREVEIVEYEFFRQDDLYYCSGSKGLSYNGVGSSDSYTAEETIRKDIANTMWRGVGSDEVGAPAWGVSTDENIFSMTINSENVNDVIQISETDGKKYYFWITMNVEGIETIDDVKAAKIEMNSL